MPQYDNTNRWTLNKNDRKETDKHPDYTGSLNVDGREFWLSAWLKDGSRGKFFSGSIKPKEPLREAANAPRSAGMPVRPAHIHAPILDDDSDGIPF